MKSAGSVLSYHFFTRLVLNLLIRQIKSNLQLLNEKWKM